MSKRNVCCDPNMKIINCWVGNPPLTMTITFFFYSILENIPWLLSNFHSINILLLFVACINIFPPATLVYMLYCTGMHSTKTITRLWMFFVDTGKYLTHKTSDKIVLNYLLLLIQQFNDNIPRWLSSLANCWHSESENVALLANITITHAIVDLFVLGSTISISESESDEVAISNNREPICEG